MTTSIAESKFSYHGMATMKQIYQIQVYLNTGYILPIGSFRLSRSDTKYLQEHFPIYKDEKLKIYVADKNLVYQVFKQDYPIVFEKEKLKDYNDLENLLHQ